MELGGQEAFIQKKGNCMKRDNIFLIIFLILAMIVIILFNPDIEKRCQKSLDREKRTEINGVVIKKYCAKGDMYPYLEIRQLADSSILERSYHGEFSGIYDYTQLGDYIYKPQGSLVYKITRGNIEKQMKFTMSCNKE